MHYTIDNTTSALQVIINGKILSHEDAAELKMELFKKIEEFVKSEGKADVVFDLKDLQMISSLGVGFLVNTLKKCKSAGGSCELNNVNDRIKKVMNITKLNSLFTIS